MSIENPMAKMKFETQKAAKAYLKELQETYARLPVMFVYQDPDSEFANLVQVEDGHRLPAIESIEVARVRSVAYEKVEIRDTDTLGAWIRDEIESEYGWRLYDDNRNKYMKLFAERAEEYKKLYKTAIVVRLAQ